MKVISRKVLRKFWEKHADAELPLRVWETKVKKADWKNVHDVKNDFGDADAVGDNRIVFNIKGNRYRLVAIVIFRNHRLYVRWVGTHNDYNRIDVTKILKFQKGMKKIKPIKTEADYDETISRINQLLDLNPAPGTDHDNELEILSTLAEAYEDKYYPILPPDPVDAIRLVMEEKGLDNKKLIPLLGSKSRVSEVMNRKKPFTLKMIYNLHKVLGLPLEIFINDRMLKGLATR